MLTTLRHGDSHTLTAGRGVVVLFAFLLVFATACVTEGTSTTPPRNAPAPAGPVGADPSVESRSDASDELESNTGAGVVVWVERVVDGDTVVLSTGERVRMVGIDAPERGECGANEATAALAALVLGRPVVLTPGASDDVDRYGRLLRYLDTDDGDAGLVLLETGLARARYDSRDGYGRHPREDIYVTADAAAPRVCDPAG